MDLYSEVTLCFLPAKSYSVYKKYDVSFKDSSFSYKGEHTLVKKTSATSFSIQFPP